VRRQQACALIGAVQVIADADAGAPESTVIIEGQGGEATPEG
jgi:hypothetical protein